MMHAPDKRELLGSWVSTGSFKLMVDSIAQQAKARASCYVCVTNVHMIMEAYQDKAFQDIVNRAFIATPDGKPVALGMSWLYSIEQPRVAGMDLIHDLLEAASASGFSVYLYGSTEEVLRRIVQRCEQDYPEATLAGWYSPPFRQLSDEEEQQIVDEINQSGAGLIMVALGCPQQEKWMARMQGKINGVMVGVGGAFPVFAGVQKRAPKWMQHLALEWFYRFLQEPRRLFKRYLITNSLYMMYFGCHYVQQQLSGRNLNH